MICFWNRKAEIMPENDSLEKHKKDIRKDIFYRTKEDICGRKDTHN